MCSVEEVQCARCAGFSMQGLVCRVQCAGFSVQGSVCRDGVCMVQCVGFSLQGPVCSVPGDCDIAWGVWRSFLYE